MEYAILLEKENRFFCVRCISKELSLSCGRKGLDETPQCVKNEGRLKPPFAGNVDIPLAGARRLISRPRKASIFHLRLSNAIPAYYGGMYLNRVALVLIIKKISAPARGQRFLLCFISKILLHIRLHQR